MRFAVKVNTVFLSLSLIAAGQLHASGYFPEELRDIQSKPIGASFQEMLDKVPNPYRQPAIIDSSMKDLGMDCIQLQREINALTKLTYSYKPRRYDDPIVGVSALAGTFVFFPFYAGLGWTTLVGYKEEKRIAEAQDQIEELRRLKAERHCFECQGGSACP